MTRFDFKYLLSGELPEGLYDRKILQLAGFLTIDQPLDGDMRAEYMKKLIFFWDQLLTNMEQNCIACDTREELEEAMPNAAELVFIMNELTYAAEERLGKLEDFSLLDRTIEASQLFVDDLYHDAMLAKTYTDLEEVELILAMEKSDQEEVEDHLGYIEYLQEIYHLHDSDIVFPDHVDDI